MQPTQSRFCFTFSSHHLFVILLPTYPPHRASIPPHPSHPILSHLIPPYHIASHRIPSHSIISHLILVPCHAMLSLISPVASFICSHLNSTHLVLWWQGGWRFGGGAAVRRTRKFRKAHARAPHQGALWHPCPSRSFGCSHSDADCNPLVMRVSKLYTKAYPPPFPDPSRRAGRTPPTSCSRSMSTLSTTISRIARWDADLPFIISFPATKLPVR
jgi:hypothetical protein